MKFEELAIKKEILQAIKENGYINPTKIQEKIIPPILEGFDVLGQSQTGTGKTLAFAASILSGIKENKSTQALILAPTRELAIQISREIEDLGRYTDIGITCVYGSSKIEDQIKKLKKGIEIVIGTPGRVKDLINRKSLNIENVKYFILDEADEMLSMGFQDDLEHIFNKMQLPKQVLLFSATMPNTILTMAKKYMNKDYKYISVIAEVKTADHVKQGYYLINDKNRVEAMCRVMDFYNPDKAIIFCRTKKNADDVLNKLSNRGYSVDVIHGDITQGQRIATLDRFKDGKFNYLIATDVATRGIHVDDIKLVINYNLPESNEAYVHRIGRTGRVDKYGMAVTFVKESEMGILNSIEKHINAKIERLELPKIEDILVSHVSDVIKIADCLKNSNNESKLFDDYLNNLSKEETKNIIKNLLEQELTHNLGCNSTTDITIENNKKKSKSRNTEDSVRVFLTIGKLDKIEKRDLLEYIEKKSKVSQGSCFNVEVMTKFTFMNIKKESFEKVFKACNETKLNGRLIRIEKAKK